MSKKVELSDKIFKALEKRIKDTKEFKDVNSYVEYILKQVIDRIEEESSEPSDEPVFSKEDEEKVKERLKGLGYLD